MQFWIIQTLNIVAFGGLLFLLSAGFSLIFGLMRIPNLAAGAGVGLLGVVLERAILRQLGGNVQGQVLVTLGISFIIADICLLVWTGDPWTVAAPAALRPPLRVAGYAFPPYR